ncbi:hypothetical protein VTI74DRAFT_5934 [Chaetomium olivicolor]
MASQFWPKQGSPGVLHHFTETLTTFEFTSPHSPSPSLSTQKPHTLLFLNGLGDGLATTSYLADLSAALHPTRWSLFTLTLSSSSQAWGFGSLDRDVDEVAQCIRHICAYKAAAKYPGHEGKRRRVVVMGHSTGCQCLLRYLSRLDSNVSGSGGVSDAVGRVAVDGGIMHAPVSDREAVLWVVKEGFDGRSPGELKRVYERLVGMARAEVSGKRCPSCCGQLEQHGQQPWDTMLPLCLTSQLGYPPNTPISCRRFLSLVSPESPKSPSDEDMFSSDLGEEQLTSTFGMLRQRGLLKGKLMVLMSGADQSVPDWVDKESLLKRWERATDCEGNVSIWDRKRSGVIPGASHALSDEDQAEPRAILVSKVLAFLEDAERDE